MMRADYIVDHLLRDRGKDDHHQCADDGAAKRARGQPRVTLEVTKNAPDRFHIRDFKLNRLEIESSSHTR